MTQAFPKPIKKKKSARILNSRIRLHDIPAPEEKHCRGEDCGKTTESESFRHIEVAWWKNHFGKGMSVKVDDNLSAWLCDDCDRVYSKKPNRDAPEQLRVLHELKWLRAIVLSHLV